MNGVNSRPYCWPYHGEIAPRQTAILVFTDPEGGKPAEAPLATLRTFVERGRAAGFRIVHLPWGPVAPTLAVEEGDLICRRPAYGGFTGTDLDLVLRGAGLTDLLIAGFPLELGADCTMREANDLGYECLLIEDCCTALSGETEAGAVSSVQMSGGIFGAVARSTDVVDAMS